MMRTAALAALAFAVTVTDASANGPNVLQMEIGNTHACMLESAGRVYCWGRGEMGQLGQRKKEDEISAPAEVTDLKGGAVAIAVGDNHGCAAMRDGKVFCWGSNGYGKLGSGEKNVYSAEPVSVKGLGTGMVVALAAGANHTCALTDLGKIKCWGANSYGQVGTGSGSTSYVPAPVSPSGLEDKTFFGISAERNYTCARDLGGKAYCWGSIDQRHQGPVYSPAIVAGLNTVSVASIEVGRGHACALSYSGQVYCWGEISDGQTGSGVISHESVQSSAELVKFPANHPEIVSLSVGAKTNCAVSVDGRLFCWGDGSRGQFGKGRVADQPSAIEILPGRFHRETWQAGTAYYSIDTASKLEEFGVPVKVSDFNLLQPELVRTYLASRALENPMGSFRVENLPFTIRRVSKDVYGYKARFFTSVAELLEKTSASPEATQAAQLVLLSIDPVIEGLTSDYAMRSIVPLYKNALGKAGPEAWRKIPLTETTRTLGLRLIRAALAAAQDFVPEKQALENLTVALGQALGTPDGQAGAKSVDRLLDVLKANAALIDRIAVSPRTESFAVMIRRLSVYLSEGR